MGLADWAGLGWFWFWLWLGDWGRDEVALRQGHHPRAPEVVLPVVGLFKYRLGLALSPPECSIHSISWIVQGRVKCV